MKNFFDWNSVEEEIVRPGIKRKIVTGKNIMLVLYEIEPGHGISEHNHPHEQMGWVLEGEMEFQIGEEKTVLKSGGVFYVPPNVPHGGKAIGDKNVLELDVFYPIREDFLKK